MPESLEAVSKSRRTAWDENTKLRYLCLRLIPELQRGTLLPLETPTERLAYLLSTVDMPDALRYLQEARQ